MKGAKSSLSEEEGRPEVTLALRHRAEAKRGHCFSEINSENVWCQMLYITSDTKVFLKKIFFAEKCGYRLAEKCRANKHQTKTVDLETT